MPTGDTCRTTARAVDRLARRPRFWSTRQTGPLSTATNAGSPATAAGSGGHAFAHGRRRRRMIELFLHARLDPGLRQRLLVFLAQEGILQPVRDRGAAFG